MTWVKLRCASCKKITSMTYVDYLAVLANEQQLFCNGCHGEMRSFGPPILRRRTAENYPDHLKQANRQELGRKSKKRMRSSLADDDSEDDDLPESQAKRRKLAEDEDDDEYLLPAEFNPAMRLTDASMEQLTTTTSGFPLSKTPGRKAVSNAVSGQRGMATSKAMGLPAWKHARKHGAANAGKYKFGGKSHYEWCHLHADSLGGLCEAGNLVAGHYAVNTYMMVIESVLKAKSGIETEVIAYGSVPDVAACIEYRIYRKGGTAPIHTEIIDGRITCFSKIDEAGVKERLSGAGLH